MERERAQEEKLRALEEAQKKIVREATLEDNQSELEDTIQVHNHDVEQSEEEDYDPFVNDRQMIDDAIRGKDIIDSFEDD